MTATTGIAGGCGCSVRLFFSGRLGFCTSGRRFTAAIFEVSGVPAATVQLETRGRQLLAERFGPTFWTCFNTRCADFAHYFGFMTATATLIIVNWHTEYHRNNLKSGLYLTDKTIAMFDSAQNGLSA